MSNSEENSEENRGQMLQDRGFLRERHGTERRLESLAKRNVSPEALRIIPSDFVRTHRILPFEISNGTIHIATADPGNQRVIDDIRLLSGLEVQESVASASEILEKIAECYQVTVEKMVENLRPEHGSNGESKNLHDIEVMANEPTVINLVNLIISTASRERASDIHFGPFEETLQLRYRIDRSEEHTSELQSQSNLVCRLLLEKKK